MNDSTDATRRSLLGNVLVPIADEEDALATCESLRPYDPVRVTAVHVIEKGEGAPDKRPVEQSEEIADEALMAVRSVFPDADTERAYARDVVDAIQQTAADIDASAIVFRPRGGSRIVQFLAGDRTLRLTTESDRPVVTLPEPADA